MKFVGRLVLQKCCKHPSCVIFSSRDVTSNFLLGCRFWDQKLYTRPARELISLRKELVLASNKSCVIAKNLVKLAKGHGYEVINF